MTLVKPIRDATFAHVDVKAFLERLAGGGVPSESLYSDTDDGEVNRYL